jgi:hypothetical protein
MDNNFEIKDELDHLKRDILRLKPFLYILLFLVVVLIAVAGFFTWNYYQLSKNPSQNTEISSQVETISQNVDQFISQQGSTSQKIDDLNQNVSTLNNLITNKNSNSTSVPLYNLSDLRLQFSCVDSTNNQTIPNCVVNVNILAVEPMREFSVQADQKAPIVIPIKTRLAISVQMDGYKPYASIFEYVDNNSDQAFQIKLEK